MLKYRLLHDLLHSSNGTELCGHFLGDPHPTVDELCLSELLHNLADATDRAVCDHSTSTNQMGYLWNGSILGWLGYPIMNGLQNYGGGYL